MKKEVNIKAILDSEMEKVLEQLEVLNLIDAGEIKCAFCDRLINRNNIAGFFIGGGEVRFCCDLIECQAMLASSKKEESDG